MARPFLLGVARLAAASSPGSASAPAYVFEVYASETVLAALRASVASAARRAGSLLAESSTSKGVRNIPLFLMEEPGAASASAAAESVDSHITARSPSSACLRSASAAADRVDAFHHYKGPSSESASASFVSSPASADRTASSTTAMSSSPPPSGSLFFALHANEWLRKSLGTSPTPPTPLVVIPTPSDARAAAHLPPYNAFISSPISRLRSRPYSTGGLVFNNVPPGFLTLEQLIAMLDKTDLAMHEEIVFRWAFNKKYTYGKVEDILHFLKEGEYTFQDFVWIQKALNHVAGPEKERMHIVVKESLSYDYPTEDEAKESPVLARMETKLDVITKILKEHGADAQKLSKFMQTKKPAWGSINVFGRNLNVAMIAEFIWRIIFGGGS